MSSLIVLSEQVAEPWGSWESQTGAVMDLDEIVAGSQVCLVFFPGVGLGEIIRELAGCTAELCEFRDQFDRIRATGTQLCAVTTQPREEFAAQFGDSPLPFPVICDPSALLATRAGVAVRRVVLPGGHARLVAAREVVLAGPGDIPPRLVRITSPEDLLDDVLAVLESRSRP